MSHQFGRQVWASTGCPRWDSNPLAPRFKGGGSPMAYSGLALNDPRTAAVDLSLEIATAQFGLDLIDLRDSEGVLALLPS
jgi:hypothetical protein